LHFIWKVKVVIGEPVYYAAILAVLLGVRAAISLRKRHAPAFVKARAGGPANP